MTRDMVLDAQGNVYITGGTTAADFPTTPGAYDRTFATGGSAVGSQGPSDVFVAKFTPDGTLEWSTYLGGPNYDRAYAIDVDAAGNVYVAGRAGPGFPTTPGVIQPNFAGDNNRNQAYGQQDGFVSKLSPDGSQLLWSTYVGEAGYGFIRDMQVDAQGHAYVGFAEAASPMPAFITADAWQSSPSRTSGLYFRLNTNATDVEYGTYFGSDGVPSLALGSDGSVAVGAFDGGANFTPTPGAYQDRGAGGFDLILMRFGANDQIIYGTYLGGSRDEFSDTHFVAMDDTGRIYITSPTNSTDYPTTAGAFDQQHSGSFDTAVSVFSPNGALEASTFIGGSGSETAEGISVARRNGANYGVVLSGRTTSSGLPVTTGAVQTSRAGNTDAFLVSFTPDLSGLNYLTYFGGGAEDVGSASAINADASRIYFGGHTFSNNFPTTPGAIDTQPTGTYAAWVASLQLD